MSNKKVEARMERLQLKRDAGCVVKHFPDVAEIVIHMTYYNDRGMKSMLRTFCFSPGSYAFFRLDCLSKSCVDGGFDLTHVITTMIRKRSAETSGKLHCEGNDPSGDNVNISYEVAIHYGVPLVSEPARQKVQGLEGGRLR
jgi:hypothetical protein